MQVAEYDGFTGIGSTVDFLDDLHEYDPVAERWRDISGKARLDTAPSRRMYHGFTSLDELIYLFAGYGAGMASL